MPIFSKSALCTRNAIGLTSRSQVQNTWNACEQRTRNEGEETREEVDAFVQCTRVSWLRPNQRFRLEQEKSTVKRNMLACFSNNCDVYGTKLTLITPKRSRNCRKCRKCSSTWVLSEIRINYQLGAYLRTVYKKWKDVLISDTCMCRIVYESKVMNQYEIYIDIINMHYIILMYIYCAVLLNLIKFKKQTKFLYTQ